MTRACSSTGFLSRQLLDVRLPCKSPTSLTASCAQPRRIEHHKDGLPAEKPLGRSKENILDVARHEFPDMTARAQRSEEKLSKVWSRNERMARWVTIAEPWRTSLRIKACMIPTAGGIAAAILPYPHVPTPAAGGRRGVRIPDKCGIK